MLHDDQALSLARRNVAEADARIRGQRRLILRLRRDGHPTDSAEQLLGLFLDTRAQMRTHRDYLAARRTPAA